MICPQCSSENSFYIKEICWYNISKYNNRNKSVEARFDRGEIDEIHIICEQCKYELDWEIEWI